VATLRVVFQGAAAVAALGFLLTLGLREVPLRGMGAAEGLSESFSMPRDATSLQELERIVTTLMAHENRWRLYADLAQRAQLDLPAPELWTLARLGERAQRSAQSLSDDLKVPRATLEAPLKALCGRGREFVFDGRRHRNARSLVGRAPQGPGRPDGALGARKASRCAGAA
jgi:hypothetical protein